MKNIRMLLLSFILIFVFYAHGMAYTVFSDNFNSENSGVAESNYSSFTKWNVTSGTVDLLSGLYGDGMFVDLDGSTDDNGTMTSKQSFTFESGKLYTLSFSLAASPNLAESTVYVQVASGALLNETITRTKSRFSWDYLFEDYNYTFIGDGTSGYLTFADGGGSTSTGMHLDNVKLDSANPVPIPGGVWLLGPGIVGMAALRRMLQK